MEKSCQGRDLLRFVFVARFMPRRRKEFRQGGEFLEFGSICDSYLLDLEEIPNSTWFGRLIGGICVNVEINLLDIDSNS